MPLSTPFEWPQPVTESSTGWMGDAAGAAPPSASRACWYASMMAVLPRQVPWIAGNTHFCPETREQHWPM
jgi:hypothetical protein